MLPFRCNPARIETIGGLIRATRIPHEPRTHLEEIMADADLEPLASLDLPSAEIAR